MESKSLATVDSPVHKRVLIVLGIVAMVGGVLFAGAFIYLMFSGQKDMAGLAGTWRDPNNPKHCYEFNPNGDLEAWNDPSKSFWSHIGWTATWRRNGQNITIKTDRNWDFNGQLEGNTIRGKMTIRDHLGTQTEIDLVWQKD